MNNLERELRVNIGSFSFKKGLPADTTVHGGGHIFDCRCVQNPGREERFKTLTGRDEPVKLFLDGHPEAQQFWTQVEVLLLQTVHKYRERGFDYLSVQFGCTGGQHRSVYFAERAAVRLQAIPGVSVTVTHRDMPR